MLDADDYTRFDRTGLLPRPGAVPAGRAAALVDLVWQHLDSRHGVVRDRPETWTVDQPSGLRAITAAPAFQALGSPAIRAALDDLLGSGHWQPPRRWGRLLVTFPSRVAQWAVPAGAWHNDFVPLRDDGALRAVQLFTILEDLPPRGGGTLVLTGSHRLVARYIADSGDPPHPSALRRALGAEPWLRELWEPLGRPAAEDRIRRYLGDGTSIDGVDLRVVELTGQAGDAFVMHCDTLHAAAPNCRDHPRMMATTIISRA